MHCYSHRMNGLTLRKQPIKEHTVSGAKSTALMQNLISLCQGKFLKPSEP